MVDFYARGIQGYEQGRQRMVRNRLNELTNIAITSPPELQRGIAAEMARVDAATGQQFAEQARSRELERLRAQAAFMQRANPQAQEKVYGAMRPALQTLGIETPEKFDPNLAGAIRGAVFGVNGSQPNLTPTMATIDELNNRGFFKTPEEYRNAVNVALRSDAGATADRTTFEKFWNPQTGREEYRQVTLPGYRPGGGAEMPQPQGQVPPPDQDRIMQLILQQAERLAANGVPESGVQQFIGNSMNQAGIPITSSNVPGIEPTPMQSFAPPAGSDGMAAGPTAAEAAAREAEIARRKKLAEADVEGSTRPGIEGATLEEKELVGMGSEFLKTSRAAAGLARSEVRQLAELERQLARIDTGAFAGTRIKLGGVAAYLGLTEGSEVSAAEAAAAITNRLALALRNPAGGEGMPGAMSDADRNFLVASIPGVENTPNGWRSMIEWRRKLADAAISQQREAERFMRDGGRLKDLPAHMQQYAERNPVFNEQAAPSTQARQVRRTGTLNGRRVVEYTDGSREYAD